MAFVYIHKNKINSKIYVGITDKKKVSQRWGKNGSAYLKDKINTRFKSALLKYGWDNFDHIVLHENISLKEAEEYEKKYIKEFDSYNPKHGYNMTLGGEGSTGHKLSKEVREKLSKYTKEQFKDKHPFLNKFGKDAARVVPVIKISMDGKEIEYCDSMIEQARKYGMRTTNIAACCNHRQKSAKGYHWMYKEEYEKLIKENKFDDMIKKLNLVELQKSPNHKSGYIGTSVKDSTEIYFKTALDIKKYFNIKDITHVYEAINGKRKTAYGFTWRIK